MLCANCGREILERGCKVRCSGCGYFEDCSDPGAPGEWAGANVEVVTRPPSDDEEENR